MRAALVALALLAGCDDYQPIIPYEAPVQCGGVFCPREQTCCLAVSSGKAVYSCRASCPDLLALECDGPEDCSGGPCCADYTTRATVPPEPVCAYVGGFACATSCQTREDVVPGCGGDGRMRKCHRAADCADDVDHPFCCGGGEFFSRCVTQSWRDSIVSNGAPCF